MIAANPASAPTDEMKLWTEKANGGEPIAASLRGESGAQAAIGMTRPRQL
jgi:hypothetical protein